MTTKKHSTDFKKTIVNLYCSARELENRTIRSYILEIYAKTDKRLGVHKIALCLRHDYRINISDGRVSRLIKTMQLPNLCRLHSKKRS